jgi:hypothetical protein
MSGNFLKFLTAFGIFLLLLGCATSTPPAESTSSGDSSGLASPSGIPDAYGAESNGSLLASFPLPKGQVSQVEKVEIIHFHGTNQCYSCKTVGAYAEETVNTYFADELKTGKITFAHINAELPENRDLVEKYGVTGASLWIGVYDVAGFHKEQNTDVWYKISDKAEYLSYLKGIIEKRLAGDLS